MQAREKQKTANWSGGSSSDHILPDIVIALGVEYKKNSHLFPYLQLKLWTRVVDGEMAVNKHLILYKFINSHFHKAQAGLLQCLTKVGMTT